jgi:WD40 repeat protein
MTEYSGPSGQGIQRIWQLNNGDNPTPPVEIARIVRVEDEPYLSGITVARDGTRLLGLERTKDIVRLRSWDVIGSEVPFASVNTIDGSKSAGKITEETLKQLAHRVAELWPRGVPRPARLSGLDDSSSQITRFALTPDGRYLATIDLENLRVIHIWDLALGREIARMNDASEELDGLLFEGAYLIAQNGAEKHSWLWQHEDMWKEACRRLTRNFSHSEWSQFLPDEPYQVTCPGLPIPSKVEEENSRA